MTESDGHRTKRRVGGFARRLSAEWRRLGLPLCPGTGDAAAGAVVAVSGGADSTALLLALEELMGAGKLSLRLRVAHLNHGLRGEAGRGDARFVAELASRLGYECEAKMADVAARARRAADNVEQAARRERYEFLGRAARGCGAGIIVTAHTLDDQAETVLLALLRGSGAGGLGGMRPVRTFDDEEPPLLLARPLLAWARHAETEDYCRARGVEWRADMMNEDERFARVRVRRTLLPLLQTFNPRAVETLSRTAALLQQDDDALEREARLLLRAAADGGTCAQAAKGEGRAHQSQETPAGDIETETLTPPLRVEVIMGATMPSVRRRALRQWLAAGRGDLRRLESAHILAVEGLLNGGRGGRVAELPGGARVERRGRWLCFRPAAAARARRPSSRAWGNKLNSKTGAS